MTTPAAPTSGRRVNSTTVRLERDTGGAVGPPWHGAVLTALCQRAVGGATGCVAGEAAATLTELVLATYWSQAVSSITAHPRVPHSRRKALAQPHRCRLSSSHVGCSAGPQQRRSALAQQSTRLLQRSIVAGSGTLTTLTESTVFRRAPTTETALSRQRGAPPV